MSERQQRGRRGERLAVAVLWLRGYRILARNLRQAGGEVDLVALHRGEIVLVEVKTRGERHPYPLIDAVTHGQRRRMLRVGRRWLARHGLRGHPIRVAAVLIRLGGRWRLPSIQVVDPLPG
jgi:putative endonuclease